MKKSILVISMLVALVTTNSCQREESNVEPIKTIAEKHSHVVSIDDALEELYAVLDAIGEPTRSRNTIEIENIHIVSRGSTTRSSDTLALNGSADTTLYLVNFADSSGYAVLGADDRLAPVYAVVDSGSINPEAFAINESPDTSLVSNLYVAEEDEYLIGGAGDNFQNELIKEATDDEGYISDENGIIGAEGSGTSITTQTTPWSQIVVPPMLKTKWSQRSPFNDKVPLNINTGNRNPAGCVAIAVARVMAYWQYPADYCRWDMVDSLLLYDPQCAAYEYGDDEEREEVASLAFNVAEGCETKYGFAETWRPFDQDMQEYSFSTPQRAVKFLNDIGYVAHKHKDYYASDEARIEANLNGGKPVLVSAFSGVWYGHMWVIDGLIKRERTIKTLTDGVVTSSKVEKQLLLHCCWGWYHGQGDGYYLSGIFSPYRGAMEFEESLGESAENSSDTRKYHWHFRTITYDIPRK